MSRWDWQKSKENTENDNGHKNMLGQIKENEH